MKNTKKTATEAKVKENRQQHSQHQGGEQTDQTRHGGDTNFTKIAEDGEIVTYKTINSNSFNSASSRKQIITNQTWKINSENNTEKKQLKNGPQAYL